MTENSTTFSLEGSNASRAIFWGGLIAGVLDISAAFVSSGLRGRSPLWVLQSIASGLLGAESFQGGLATAALGAACHFLIAFVACAVFYAASRSLSFLVQHFILSGLLYGVAVYAFMNLVVLRIAFQNRISYPPAVLVTGLLIIIICVGLPISLVVHHYSK
jgi:hypothetical protein